MPPIRCTLTGITVAVLCSASAHAACFELIGCTDGDRYSVEDLSQLSCENLWLVRNTVFDENGYCFQTDRAAATFSNDGCTHNDPNQVRLSSVERHNVNQILQVESQKGCP